VSIVSDGRTLDVQPNCEYALRQLRTHVPFGMQWFWNDALCINQADEVEKGVQVQAMAKIFAGADTIAISYGVDTDVTAACMRALESRFKSSTSGPTPDHCRQVILSDEVQGFSAQTRYSKRHEGDHIGPKLPPYSPTAVQEDWDTSTALANIGRRPYWSRLWIVQELFMTWNVVFLHREGTLSLQYLRDFVSGFSKDLLELRDDVGGRWAARLTDMPMMHLLYHLKSLRLSDEPGLRDYRTTWATALRRTAHLGCRDWRDRVYALMNIVPSESSVDLRVNYSISRFELATDLLRSCARRKEPELRELAETLCKVLKIDDRSGSLPGQLELRRCGLVRTVDSALRFSGCRPNLCTGNACVASEDHCGRDPIVMAVRRPKD